MAAAEGTHRVRFNERAASMSAAGRSMDEALGIPHEAVLRQVLAGLAAAGFGDARPANFTVFQHTPPEGIRLTVLADAALMTKQSMGYLVDDLEALGYIERAPDADDRRAKVVHLTTRGRQMEADWSARLGHEDYQQLSTSEFSVVAALWRSGAVARPPPARRRPGPPAGQAQLRPCRGPSRARPPLRSGGSTRRR